MTRKCNAISSASIPWTLKDKEAMFRIRTIMTSSPLPPITIPCSVAPRAETSVRLRVRATHSSWTPPSTSDVGIYADCAGLGTSKKADKVCTCAGDDGLVDCGGVKDGGGSRAPSPTASAGADKRFCCGSRRNQASRTRSRAQRYVRMGGHVRTESVSGNASVCALCEKRASKGRFPLAVHTRVRLVPGL
jgi:hypothetical protein